MGEKFQTVVELGKKTQLSGQMEGKRVDGDAGYAFYIYSPVGCAGCVCFFFCFFFSLKFETVGEKISKFEKK
jgi:hypothetical protein